MVRPSGSIRGGKFAFAWAVSLRKTCSDTFKNHDEVLRAGLRCALLLLMLSGCSASLHLLAAQSAIPAAPLENLKATQIPASLFGMTLISGTAWPTVSVGALGKGTGVNWPYIEPPKNIFNWDRLDAWMRLAEHNRVDFFYSNDLVPPWAAADPKSCRPTYPGSQVVGCTSTVADPQDWDRFVTALATRYRGRMIYELWNEPYTHSFTGTVDDMVVLTTHEYRIVRAVDPRALILAPSGTSAYMDRYFAAGGPTGVDVVTFHSYQSTPEAVIRDAFAMTEVATKYGLATKPIWDTEGAWSTVPDTLTADQQSSFLARMYLLLWSQGVSRFYWYAWDSAAFGSLWSSARGSSSAAHAYAQVYEWMVGATMDRPCLQAQDATWTCTLSRPGGYRALAVWNSSATKSYEPTASYRFYLDLAGEKHRVNAAVTVGSQPILFVDAP